MRAADVATCTARPWHAGTGGECAPECVQVQAFVHRSASRARGPQRSSCRQWGAAAVRQLGARVGASHSVARLLPTWPPPHLCVCMRARAHACVRACMCTRLGRAHTASHHPSPNTPPTRTTHTCRPAAARTRLPRAGAVVAQAADKAFDYDLVIIGCGVGGHGAALHAVEQVRAPACLCRSVSRASRVGQQGAWRVARNKVQTPCPEPWSALLAPLRRA